MIILKSIIKEPLTHFVIIGTLLFYFYFLLNPEPEPTFQRGALSITPEGIAERLNNHSSMQQALTNQAEINRTQINAYVTQLLNNELLFQEAILLDMHHSSWVKERLARQMLRYYEGQYIPDELNEKTLADYYDQHFSRYQTSDKISFEQFLINAEKKHEVQSLFVKNFDQDRLKEKLTPYKEKTLLSAEFRRADRESIERLFGELFVDQLLKLPLGKWQPSILSDRGLHVVRLNKVELGIQEEYQSVKEKVKNDLIAEKRAKWVARKTSELWEKYDIKLGDYLPK